MTSQRINIQVFLDLTTWARIVKLSRDMNLYQGNSSSAVIRAILEKLTDDTDNIFQNPFDALQYLSDEGFAIAQASRPRLAKALSKEESTTLTEDVAKRLVSLADAPPAHELATQVVVNKESLIERLKT